MTRPSVAPHLSNSRGTPLRFLAACFPIEKQQNSNSNLVATEKEKREKKKKKVAQGNVGFVVFMICFLKNGAPKSCLKIQKVTQNGKLAHTLTHKNTRHRYVATTHTHTYKQKRERERERERKSGREKEEEREIQTINTHTSKKKCGRKD